MLHLVPKKGLWLPLVLLCLWMGISCSPTDSSEPAQEPATEVTTDTSTSDDASTPEASTPETKGEANTPEGPAKETGSPDTPAPTCNNTNIAKPTKDFFVDISKKSGIQVENFLKRFNRKVPINDHSRLGFADINGDGYPDIIAHSLFPNPQAGIPFQHLVFLNNGDGTFKNFSTESGLRKVQAGFFAFADVDNDGDQDCFAGIDIPMAGHTNQIYLNDGKGHFTLKANSGVNVKNLLAMNAVFADFNNDGKLDLYIGSGGSTYRMKDSLFFGNGDGTFTNQTSKLAGLTSLSSNGTVTCDYDNDGDQDIIVSTYGVSNLLGHNMLWQNDGKGNFTNVARAKGFEALPGGNYAMSSTGFGSTPEPGKQPGQYVGSNGFGVDCKDVNNDGNYDVFLTTISHPNEGIYSRKWSDPSQLLINSGKAGQYVFKNEFLKRKLPFNEGDIDGALHDFDNDGRLDVSISRENKYEKAYTQPDQKGWFGLFHQKADGTFTSLTMVSGINKETTKNSASLKVCQTIISCTGGETCLFGRCRQPCTKDEDCKSSDDFCSAYWETNLRKTVRFCRSRLLMKGAQNHAWADVDRDGDLDLLIGGRDKGGGRPNYLFRNEIGSKNRWIALKMVGDGQKINRDAIGTRVSLVFKNAIISREVQSSRGMYNSIDTKMLHFGLGAFDCQYEVKIRWSNGEIVSLPAGALKEGKYATITYPNKVEIK